MVNKDGQTWIGHVIRDSYRIDEPLGEGGQSVVYRGTDIMMSMPVAIKHFKRFSKGVENNSERFLREAKTQAGLVHQNIVGIRAIFSENAVDSDDDEGKEYFIVMEYVEGGSLVEMIEKADLKNPPLEEIARIFEEILDGLGFAHRKGILHRDVKPSNILLTEDRQVKLADFGLARVLEAKRLTQTGLVLGTPAYIAPEQIDGSGDIDHRCDIYSVGVMFYEVLCGHPPFQKPGENLAPFELMGRHLFMEPPSLIEMGIPISQELEDVIMKGLAKRADERFADCKEFRDALSLAIRGEAPSSSRSGADLDVAAGAYLRAPTPSAVGIRVDPSGGVISAVSNPSGAAQALPSSGSIPAVSLHQQEVASQSSGSLPSAAGLRVPTSSASSQAGPPRVSLQDSVEKTVVQLAVDPAQLRDDTDAFAQQDDVDYTMQTVIHEGISFGEWEEGSGEHQATRISPYPAPTAHDTYPEGVRAPLDALERKQEMSSRSRSHRRNKRTSMVPFALMLFAGIMLIGIWWFFYGRNQIHSNGPSSGTVYPQKIRGVLMVKVKAGPFWQGKDTRPRRGKYPAHAPQRQVNLGEFWIDQFEVTVHQYQQCVQAKACPSPADFSAQLAMPIAPVVSVSWEDARRFCAWSGKRLPFEAEWEKAARGSDARPYPWGKEPPYLQTRGEHISDPKCHLAIVEKCLPGAPVSVGETQRREGRSPFGAYDMVGNVREWVEDCYVQRAYHFNQVLYTNNGCKNKKMRVVRGGSYLSTRKKLTTYARDRGFALGGEKDLGFRCAWSRSDPR